MGGDPLLRSGEAKLLLRGGLHVHLLQRSLHPRRQIFPHLFQIRGQLGPLGQDGGVLHLGWDYNAPYNLDPLNGVDVDIQTAQGINQTGTTVERQSVAGVSRTLSVVFWGNRALDTARNFARKLPYYTTGTMYFGDAYFTRFVVQKTPYFSSYTEPRCELMLYSPKPYWYGLTATARVLGGYQPAFTFPVCYDSHTYGIRQDGEANC